MSTRRTPWPLSPVAALLLLAVGLPPTPAEAQPRPRIAVVGFENNSSFTVWGDRLGLAAQDELTTQLVRTGAFSVIERAQLEQVLNEQRLAMSGAVDPRTAARIGEILGVNYVLMGSITQFSIERHEGRLGPVSASYSEAESILDVRVVDVNSAEILMVADGNGTKRFGGAGYRDIDYRRNFDQGVAQEALRPAVEQTVEKLLEARASTLARVSMPPASIVGEREGAFYLDRGENAGLEVGQRLDVYRVVDEIRDAAGALLDRVTEKVGVIELDRVLTQSAIGRVVEGSAREGDTVSLDGRPPS
jgi:curli biogenesis system outer membrane secretion channel CsgG